MYKDTQQLLKLMGDGKLASALKSSPCLVTAAEVKHQKQMVHIIGLVKGLKIKEKKLILLDHTLNSIILTNITINFPVIIRKIGKGIKTLCILGDLIQNGEKLINSQARQGAFLC